jgi:2-oxoisovalerate dehydrogenase E1 component subunit alpha
MRAFKQAESLKRHELKEVFSDVYGGEEPLNLVGVPRSPFPPSPPPSPPFPASSTLRREIFLHFSMCLQKEQREELTRLLRKYGSTWEPWKAEMMKFKDNGESLLGRTE